MNKREWKKEHPWVVTVLLPFETPFGKSRATLQQAFTTEAEADKYIDWARSTLAIGVIPRTEIWNWRDVESVQTQEGRCFKTLATCSPGRPTK